jgi:hypothetical protein
MTDKEFSIWKRVFEKKYIGTVAIAAIIASIASIGDNTLALSLAPIVTVIAIVLAVNSEKKKFLVFVIGLVLYTLLYLSFVTTANKLNKDESTVARYMAEFKKQNEQLPKKANEFIELVKYEFPNNNTVKMHGRYFGFEKSELVAEYGTIEDLEKQLTEQELSVSCASITIFKLIDAGGTMKITYTDKNDFELATVVLNKETCRPYFK